MAESFSCRVYSEKVSGCWSIPRGKINDHGYNKVKKYTRLSLATDLSRDNIFLKNEGLGQLLLFRVNGCWVLDCRLC